MTKLKKFVSLLLVSLLLCSCASSGTLKKIENKVFDGDSGAQLVIVKEKFKSPKLMFHGPSLIKPNTNPEEIEKNRDKYVKIEERDGKKYIIAKDFKYKLVVVDENTILDEEDNVNYRCLPDLYKDSKK